MATKKAKEVKEIAIEDKLRMLFEMQMVDSEIDKVQSLRGELPLEVRDLEDDIVRLETRLEKHTEDTSDLSDDIKSKKVFIDECTKKIAKYEKDQGSVRNNREYDALNKEVEYEKLEIELAQKHIKEFKIELDAKGKQIETIKYELGERQADLAAKKKDLDNIIEDTETDETKLAEKSNQIENVIEPRLIIAYKRIRNNARNGLAVVSIHRGACGGCFNKIPPQRQLDVKLRKKIIVCEHCGRILVDDKIMGGDEEVEEIEEK